MDKHSYDPDFSVKQEQFDSYYAPTRKIVLVPVEVFYHDATDIVYKFTAPTFSDIEIALKNSNK